MKPVIIYTLNKQETLVPHYQDYIQSYSHDEPPNFVCGNGDEPYKEAKINFVFMPIIQITKCHSNGLGLEPTCYDKYVAVDPELMEVLRYRHEQELSTQYNKLNSTIEFLIEKCEEYSDKLIAFYKLPWYKRIWKATTLDI